MEYIIYKNKGAALLLTLLILTAILAIAFGVSTLIFGETKMSQEVPKSLRAYYIAEAGIERKLYEIRQQSNFADIGSAPNWCSGAGKVCLDPPNNTSCYAVDVTIGAATSIKGYGCYKGTRRAVEVSY